MSSNRRHIDVGLLSEYLQQFAADREWEQFHTPKNLMLALVGEVGELAAELQWLTDEEVEALNTSPTSPVSSEIADVAIYLVRLTDMLGIDLDAAIAAKLKLNETRFPTTG